MRSGLLVLAVLPLLAACDGVDESQARICERLIPALGSEDAAYDVIARDAVPDDPREIRIVYTTKADEPPRPTVLRCRFAGAGFAPNRLELEAVETDGQVLSPVEVFMLRHFWLERYAPRAGAGAAGRDRPRATPPYLAQLAANAVTLASVYAVLAAGYTLIFAITRRINLVFGALAVLGAYAVFSGIVALRAVAADSLVLLLAMALVVAVMVGASLGYAVERLVFRPLHDSRGQALLIASLGLAIALQEAVRLLHGAGDRWLQPILAGRIEVAAGSGASISVTVAQLACVAVAAAVFLGLYALARSSVGRQLRAVAEDPVMAALCGARTGPLIAFAFALSGCLAALAGTLVLLRYGAISASDGWLLGFKALTAAVVGGIGSLGGALLGALLIAFIETAWAGFFASAWREVVVFLLLAATLIWRPEGLLGRPLPLAARER